MIIIAIIEKMNTGAALESWFIVSANPEILLELDLISTALDIIVDTFNVSRVLRCNMARCDMNTILHPECNQSMVPPGPMTVM